MKKILILFFFSILFFKCQSTSEGIRFSNIKTSYKNGEKFSFQLGNNLKGTFEYYVGIEAFFNNSWQEILLDIDTSAPDKAAIIKILLPNQNKKETYKGFKKKSNLKIDSRVTEDDVLKIKSYRFVLNYRIKNESDFKQQYSVSFFVH